MASNTLPVPQRMETGSGGAGLVPQMIRNPTGALLHWSPYGTPAPADYLPGSYLPPPIAEPPQCPYPPGVSQSLMQQICYQRAVLSKYPPEHQYTSNCRADIDKYERLADLYKFQKEQGRNQQFFSTQQPNDPHGTPLNAQKAPLPPHQTRFLPKEPVLPPQQQLQPVAQRLDQEADNEVQFLFSNTKAQLPAEDAKHSGLNSYLPHIGQQQPHHTYATPQQALLLSPIDVAAAVIPPQPACAAVKKSVPHPWKNPSWLEHSTNGAPLDRIGDFSAFSKEKDQLFNYQHSHQILKPPNNRRKGKRPADLDVEGASDSQQVNGPASKKQKTVKATAEKPKKVEKVPKAKEDKAPKAPKVPKPQGGKRKRPVDGTEPADDTHIKMPAPKKQKQQQQASGGSLNSTANDLDQLLASMREARENGIEVDDATLKAQWDRLKKGQPLAEYSYDEDEADDSESESDEDAPNEPVDEDDDAAFLQQAEDVMTADDVDEATPAENQVKIARGQQPEPQPEPESQPESQLKATEEQQEETADPFADLFGESSDEDEEQITESKQEQPQHAQAETPQEQSAVPEQEDPDSVEPEEQHEQLEKPVEPYPELFKQWDAEYEADKADEAASEEDPNQIIGEEQKHSEPEQQQEQKQNYVPEQQQTQQDTKLIPYEPREKMLREQVWESDWSEADD